MGDHVFENFRPGMGNELKIASLVPLVEESYGIYQFIVNLLMAMHQSMFITPSLFFRFFSFMFVQLL
jgi:hypothetical protein